MDMSDRIELAKLCGFKEHSYVRDSLIHWQTGEVVHKDDWNPYMSWDDFGRLLEAVGSKGCAYSIRTHSVERGIVEAIIYRDDSLQEIGEAQATDPRHAFCESVLEAFDSKEQADE